MIALLCPSRGRPEQLKRMWNSVKQTAGADVKLYLATSPEDVPAYSEVNGNSRKYALPDNLPTGFKWNLLADEAMRNTDNRLFMLAADDMVFTTPCWDEAIISHYNNLENKIHVYALQDTRDKNGTPHPIVTREYIEAMGYFLPPQFLHWHIDSWTVEIAKANNCFTHLKEYELLHDKPSDKGDGDETHSRIRVWGWRQRDQWVNEKLRSAGFMAAEQRRLMSVIKNGVMAA